MRQVLRRTGLLVLAAALALAGLPGVATASTGPAIPQRLYARNGATSITVSWTQPAGGSRPVYFRVYENGAVVARNTTIHATVGNLVFNSTHTYTVTAVDRYGRESAPSAPITRTAIIGGPFGCGLTAPTGLVASNITASAVSLSWSNAQPYWDQPGTLLVLLDGAVVQQTTLDSARISGLPPASTHTVQVARRDCNGTLHPSNSLTVTTLSGGSGRPGAPTGLTVGARTNTSIALSWAPSTGADPAVRYQVYDGADPGRRRYRHRCDGHRAVAGHRPPVHGVRAGRRGWRVGAERARRDHHPDLRSVGTRAHRPDRDRAVRVHGRAALGVHCGGHRVHRVRRAVGCRAGHRTGGLRRHHRAAPGDHRRVRGQRADRLVRLVGPGEYGHRHHPRRTGGPPDRAGRPDRHRAAERRLHRYRDAELDPADQRRSGHRIPALRGRRRCSPPPPVPR